MSIKNELGDIELIFINYDLLITKNKEITVLTLYY